MPLSTRYGFADAPTSAIKGDSSLGWTTLASTIAAGAASGTLSVASSAGFPSAVQFDIDLGLRDVTTGLWSNTDELHITVVSGTTWTWTRTDTTLAHAIGESISHVVTAAGLANNPGAKTDAGDFEYLNASGRLARLAAPADGDYALRWTSAVPSWSATVAPTFSGSIAATQVAVGTGANALGGSADLTWDGGGLTLNGSTDPEGWVYAKTINAVLYSTSTDRNDYFHSSFAVVANPTGDITLPLSGVYNFELELNGSHAYRGGVALSGEVDVNGTAFSSAGDGVFVGQHGIANWFSAGTLTGTGPATGLMGLRGSAQIYAGVVPIIRGVHGWTGIYGGSVTGVAASFVAEPSGTGVPVTAGAVNAGLYVADWTGEGLNTYALWYNGVGAGAGVWRVNQFGVMAYYNPTFAAYTPGTTAFERIKVEWVGDVATIGTEAGITGGVSRVLNLVGSDVQANGVSLATQTYVNAQGFVTASSATAFSNKTGAITQWSNDASYTTLAAVAAVGYATATSSTAFSNKSGNISQWTNDASYTTLAAVAGVGYLTSVTAHNLLSATHGDTTAASVSRGDVLTGQGASAKWARLAKGTANQVLAMDGTATDVIWATVSAGSSGTVTSVALSLPSIITVSGSPVTTTGTLTGTLATQVTKTFFAGPTSGADATPTFRVLAAADVPDLSATYSPVAGNASLVTVGTIATGTWNATAIAVAKGGTGSAFFTVAGPTQARIYTFPDAAATIARTDAANTFTGVQTMTSPALTTPAIATGAVITEAVGTSALVLTGAIQTTSFPVLSATQTWNASGTTFTAFDVTVTNTASAAASLLLNLKVGASSALKVVRTGELSVNTLSGTTAVSDQSGNWFIIAGTSTSAFRVSATAGASHNWGGALGFYYDAASIVSFRNGTTATNLRVQNTFTTVTTAGEWFKHDWKTTANQFRMGAAMGTSSGTARVASWDYGGLEASPSAAITVPITSGNIVFGGGVQLSNAAVTGLVAGLVAGTTNATIVLYDSSGQAYRVPCII